MKGISQYCTSMMNRLSNFPSFGCENTNIVDVLISFLLAISPLLQHYKGVVVNAGILVLILCLPYVCLRLLFRFRSLQWKNIWIALPLVLFQVFRVIAHGTTFMEFAHGAVLCGYFIAIALGGINLKFVARSAYLVAMAAGIGIILQGICYYLLGFHLQLVVTDWLLEESNAWVKLAQTGIIGITGKASAFYRPSAFFLEPSHMFLYFVPNLFLLLLTPEMNWLKRISAVILSIGLVLSTSGMGIALVVGAWLLQLGFGKGKENRLRFQHLFSRQNILRCVAFVLIFAVIAFCLPFLRYSILRVFVGSQKVNAMIAAEEAEKAAQLANKDKPIVDPTPTNPAPTDPAPTDPAPTDPAPTNPAPTDPAPTDPAPTDPAPTDPAPTNPAPTDPAPTNPAPTDPVPTNPASEPTKIPEETLSEAEKLAQEKADAAAEAEKKAQENAGSTAISGRMERAISLIRYRMSGSQYLVGVSDSVENIKFNLPGFFATMYKYGIIGTVLSYIFYLCCAIFGKGAYRWMAIIILGVSFFSAHTHGTFYMLFYVLMLMDSLIQKPGQNRKELKNKI